MKIDSLKAAIITAVTRPKVKGDTIEYNTRHYSLQPNATVEELLRRLPGLQINPDGTITYNGEKVGHLLVNGEDIFGNNPTMVTRNFDASKIARVEILNRKSDQTLFTGIDDGTRTKTLNLVLKEDAQNGYFGRADAGGNTGGDYNVDGYAAGFRDKEQFTTIAMASNTGSLNFSGNGGDVGYLQGISDPMGTSAGTGIPHFYAAALHYADIWKESAEHLAGNYQFSHFYTQPVTITQTYQAEPDSVYGQDQRNQSTNQYDQHWIYANYDWAPNAATAFMFSMRASNTQERNEFGATGSSTFNGTLVNSSLRTIQDRMSQQNSAGTLAWRTRIGGRDDRILSITTAITQVDPTVNGYLYSINRFYQPNGQLQSVDTVDQRKQIISHSINSYSSVNFTEPLWKGAVLGLRYGLSLAGDRPLQATFNRGDGKYDEVVDSLTSHLKTQTTNQQFSLNLQGKTGRLNYTIGNDWMLYHYHQQDLMSDSAIHLQYFNWAPRVFANYAVNPSSGLDFIYNASTEEPTLAQLTPIANNNDPLHISIGNPNLKPAFNQYFHLNFHRFKTWLIDVGLAMTLANTNISTKTTTDSLGRQISQSVNVAGGKTGEVNFSISRKLLGFDAGIHVAGTYTQNISYVNADLSKNDAYTGGGGFTLNKYVPDTYSLQLSSNWTYFDQVSSINTNAPVHYWTQNHSGALTLFFRHGFEFNTNATYAWQQKTSAFAAGTSVLIWSGSIDKHFLHNKLVTRLAFNNILNSDAGITRSNTGNTNTQSSTNILGRYWMLSVSYHFDKKFKKK